MTTNPNPTSPQPLIPAGGQKIMIYNGRLQVPDRPIIPFIKGNSTSRDI